MRPSTTTPSMRTRDRRGTAGFAAAALAVSAAVFAVGTSAASAPSLLHARDDFDARSLMRPAPAGPGSRDEGSVALSASHAGRFSMAQSYSLTALSGPGGSASSGLYLNTLSYRLTPLLTASVDVGFHTPIHSTVPGIDEPGAGAGSMVLPRMGLEYRPSDRLSINFELINAPDAWKAYGGAPWSSPFAPGAGSRP